MRSGYPHESLQIPAWKYKRLRFRRLIYVAHDLMSSLLLVAFCAVMGFILGALILRSLWFGMIPGAVLGGLLGVKWAKRVFFREPEPEPDLVEAELMPPEPTPGAPRLYGVEEQYKKILFRHRILSGLFSVPILLVCYLRFADHFDWPVPFSLPLTVLIWGAIGFLAVVLLLGTLMLRCPKCGGVLLKANLLSECPHCGVVLRG